MVAGREMGGPAFLHHDGLVRLDQQGGPGDAHAGLEIRPEIDPGRMPGLLRIEASLFRRHRRLIHQGPQAFLDAAAPADRLGEECVEGDLLGLVDEAEARAMGGLEGRLHLRKRAERNG